jgi:hypothetical protein
MKRKLRRLPDNDIPGCAGFWFGFKAHMWAHSTAMYTRRTCDGYNCLRNVEDGREDK